MLWGVSISGPDLRISLVRSVSALGVDSGAVIGYGERERSFRF